MTKKTFKLSESDFNEITQCPLCGGGRKHTLRMQKTVSIYTEIYPKYSLLVPSSFAKRELLQCQDCGHVYWDVIPKLECLPSYEKEILDYGFDESRALSKKAAFINQFLERDGMLVDIGACRGELLREIRQLNRTAILMGVEPSFELSHEDESINIIKALFDSNLPLECSSISIFSAIDVFEHMPRLDEIFNSANLFLKQGGIIYIESPNGDYFYNRIINYDNINLFWIEHLSFLTSQSIDFICERFGFEKILVESVAHVETDILRRSKSMIKGLVLNKFFKSNRPMYINSSDHLKILLRKK